MQSWKRYLLTIVLSLSCTKHRGAGGGDADGNGGTNGEAGSSDGGFESPANPLDKGVFDAPDCMSCKFPGDMAPLCPGSAVRATLVYPPDDVLLPPNMNTLSIQFSPQDPTVQMFEVAIQSAATDVRIRTRCTTGTVDTRGMPSGGCEVQVNPDIWASVIKSNRGGSVKVSVRATPDGTCTTMSTNARSVRFAEDDIVGTIYYWKSTITAAGTGGHIWAKKFGSADPEMQFTRSGPSGTRPSTCYGCHFLSHDAKRMLVGADDDDSDDSFSDVTVSLFDVAAKMELLTTPLTPGFMTFSPDHAVALGSAGDGTITILDGDNGQLGMPDFIFPLGPDGGRPTMPDWSPDGKTVLLVVPKLAGSTRFDDHHIFGGSLYTMDTMGMGVFGSPVPLLASAGENNYYPSYSPDGQFVVFNRVALTGTVDTIDDCPQTGEMGTCPNDSFSNRAARIMILPTQPGAKPIDPELANDSPASDPVPVSNSWPRWTPYIQMYKGSKLLWVTFSSTRDYGLRVRNHMSAMDQCYPPDSNEWPEGDNHAKFGANCQQPQIWMAPINLTAAGATVQGATRDPTVSRAFWLPFQDITTHNHTAQWTP